MDQHPRRLPFVHCLKNNHGRPHSMAPVPFSSKSCAGDPGKRQTMARLRIRCVLGKKNASPLLCPTGALVFRHQYRKIPSNPIWPFLPRDVSFRASVVILFTSLSHSRPTAIGHLFPAPPSTPRRLIFQLFTPPHAISPELQALW